MREWGGKKEVIAGFLVALSLLVVGWSNTAWAAPREHVDFTVEVKDADSGEPIFQARLTLQFNESGSAIKLRRGKAITYSAKTNAKGRYKFTGIPKGTIRLLVTADRHQSYGEELELTEDNQVIEVKLRRPQPLL
jgi:hypothetical protein